MEAVEASCTAEGENPFGRVSDGYLILRGVVLEATLLPLATTRDESMDPWEFTFLIRLLADFDGIETCFGSDCTDLEEFYFSAPPVSLLIFSYDTDTDGTTEIFMLVLRKLDREELVYERLGTAYIRDKPANCFDSANPSTIKII